MIYSYLIYDDGLAYIDIEQQLGAGSFFISQNVSIGEWGPDGSALCGGGLSGEQPRAATRARHRNAGHHLVQTSETRNNIWAGEQSI